MTSPQMPGFGTSVLEDTRLDEQPLTTDNGDHERLSHYVPKDKLTEGMINGTPVIALCGKVWVPSRDPREVPRLPGVQGDLGEHVRGLRGQGRVVTRRAAVAGAATVLAMSASLLSLTSAGPAAAAPRPAAVPAGSVPCVEPSATGRTDPRPPWRENADVTPVTPADLAALPAQDTGPRQWARAVEPVLPRILTVPVYAHVIKGKHPGEQAKFGPRRLQHLIDLLNAGMRGDQSSSSAPLRYRFELKRADYTKRDGWYHAYFNGPRDRRAKTALHRGGDASLNLYINGGGPPGQPVLGWSRFPWQYASAPRLDGVSVNVAALPGGRARGYNLGDTLIHETGHWLGLFHTFEGGCSATGDLVEDTPAEAEPSFYCETTRDTCSSPGNDPVRNFMDYSLDSCMNMFTPGQVRRVDVAFARWRLRG